MVCFLTLQLPPRKLDGDSCWTFANMDRLSVAGLTIGLALIGVSNLPVVWSVFRSKACRPGYYRDEDGEATEIIYPGTWWQMAIERHFGLLPDRIGLRICHGSHRHNPRIRSSSFVVALVSFWQLG